LRATCGGIFRDYRTAIKGCLSVSLGRHTALEAELFSTANAIKIAQNKKWWSLWIESDSTSV